MLRLHFALTKVMACHLKDKFLITIIPLQRHLFLKNFIQHFKMQNQLFHQLTPN